MGVINFAKSCSTGKGDEEYVDFLCIYVAISFPTKVMEVEQ